MYFFGDTHTRFLVCPVLQLNAVVVRYMFKTRRRRKEMHCGAWICAVGTDYGFRCSHIAVKAHAVPQQAVCNARVCSHGLTSLDRLALERRRLALQGCPGGDIQVSLVEYDGRLGSPCNDTKELNSIIALRTKPLDLLVGTCPPPTASPWSGKRRRTFALRTRYP